MQMAHWLMRAMVVRAASNSRSESDERSYTALEYPPAAEVSGVASSVQT